MRRDEREAESDASPHPSFAGSIGESIPPHIITRAENRLALLAAANRLEDLRSPPSLRLETLHGDRQEQRSIRINDQWRICFVWTGRDAVDVEIVDYH